jgi:dienelactone hydrolase
VPAAGAARHPRTPRLSVTPSHALVDQSVNIRVRGVRGLHELTLEATARDIYGRAWRSRLSLKPNRKNVVETHFGMKLFWAMKRVRPSNTAVFLPSLGPSRVRIRALAGRRPIASAVLVRRVASSDLASENATLSRDGFVGRFFARRSGAAVSRPAVLQLGGSDGGYRYLPAALLAAHGYPTLSLAYFKEPGLPKTLKDIPLEYFARALKWLARQPGVDPNRLVVYGVSRGGEAALLVGASYPDLVHGVIAATPSSDVNGAYPGPGEAWTLGGSPVPRGPIPVERIAGPVLVTGGGKDSVWPSAFYVRQILARARSNGRTDVVGRIYRDAGHGVGFGVPNIPISGIVVEELPGTYLGVGGTPRANAVAAAEAWPTVLSFFRNMSD